MPAPATLAQVVAALERRYPLHTAEPWDAVGLVAGEPDQPVRRVLLAVDPVAEVAEEALDLGADLLVTHHPLFLRGVHSVAADTAKGRLVSRLIRGGCALYTAHTNADVAAPGVSDALAACFDLRDLRPLQPLPSEPLDSLTVFVPTTAAEVLVDALAAAGAGAVGDYDRCAFTVTGTGTFRPLSGARPAVGEVGAVAVVGESRVEMVLPRLRRVAVLAALRAVHPYEEPAFALVEQAAGESRRGLGRVGELPAPLTLAALVARAVAVLPATAAGVRAGGDPDLLVRTLAVSGGAGDSLLGAAAGSGAQAFLTADLRHHPARERLDTGGLALLDAAHWATEWPWLGQAGRLLRDDLAAWADGGGAAATVEVVVSTRVTDPWSLHSG